MLNYIVYKGKAVGVYLEAASVEWHKCHRITKSNKTNIRELHRVCNGEVAHS